MAAVNTTKYKDLPGERLAEIKSTNALPSTLLSSHPIICDGNKITLDAKIGGITPAMFILNGKWVFCPCTIRFPICRRA